jgi:hypothetical protein
MRYKDITLAPDDIEWLKPTDGAQGSGHDRLKWIIWDDDEFNAYVGEHGIEEAHERVHRFHRDVANQLIARGVRSRLESDWAWRAIGLCRQVKFRRQELRRWYQVHHGQTALMTEAARLDAAYPRATWGGD